MSGKRLATGLTTGLGLARSALTYRLAPRRAKRMRALYAQFVKPGDLVFDIGAHVGDRVATFRALGATVVAVEPQPQALFALRLAHGRDSDVHLIEAAVGGKEGSVTLHINSANPTVSTVSRDFVNAAEGAPGWEGQTWDRAITVPMTTLAALIEKFGTPAFVKIDVEGAEADVLSTLDAPVAALSFELTTIRKSVALEALDHLESRTPHGYDISLGESQSMTFDTPVDAKTMADHIRALPDAANSGDIYAWPQNHEREETPDAP